MSDQPSLLDWEAPKNARFDGATYNHERDSTRLGHQLQLVFNAMGDGEWKTLARIAFITGEPEASISSRLRDLRKVRFGSRSIDKRHIAKGLWEYKMVL